MRDSYADQSSILTILGEKVIRSTDDKFADLPAQLLELGVTFLSFFFCGIRISTPQDFQLEVLSEV